MHVTIKIIIIFLQQKMFTLAYVSEQMLIMPAVC